MPCRVALLVVFAVAMTLFCVTATVTAQCTKGCEPWYQSPACTVGQTMKVIFTIDVAPENANVAGTNNTVAYSFCPKVDQLQAFSLNGSSALAGGNLVNSTLSATANQSYLHLLGATGNAGTEIPVQASYGAALIFATGLDTSMCQSGMAVASMLVLNFTMTDGMYRMTSSFGAPIQVGFMPTCTDSNNCAMGGTVCLGLPGFKNCGTCVNSFADLEANPIQVFASYYGTDSNGRTLTSGTENPLNFRALAADSVFNTVKNSVSNL